MGVRFVEGHDLGEIDLADLQVAYTCDKRGLSRTVRLTHKLTGHWVVCYGWDDAIKMLITRMFNGPQDSTIYVIDEGQLTQEELTADLDLEAVAVETSERATST